MFFEKIDWENKKLHSSYINLSRTKRETSD